jgi:hypothetical protein
VLSVVGLQRNNRFVGTRWTWVGNRWDRPRSGGAGCWGNRLKRARVDGPRYLDRARSGRYRPTAMRWVAGDNQVGRHDAEQDNDKQSTQLQGLPSPHVGSLWRVEDRYLRGASTRTESKRGMRRGTEPWTRRAFVNDANT